MIRSHKGGMAKKRVRPFVLFFHRRAAPARFAPSRPGAVDGLLVPLAHGLMRTPCGEQKRHWYRIMDFATLTSGKAPSSTRAPSKAPCCSATFRRNPFRQKRDHCVPVEMDLCNAFLAVCSLYHRMMEIDYYYGY